MMTTIYDLHDEVLSTILVLLAMSSNGAADLARLSSTCSRFRSLARQSFVLKAVNFRKISREYNKKNHHLGFQNKSMRNYEKDQRVINLLHQCALAGNLAAESRLKKARLSKYVFLRSIIKSLVDSVLARHGSKDA